MDALKIALRSCMTHGNTHQHYMLFSHDRQTHQCGTRSRRTNAETVPPHAADAPMRDTRAMFSVIVDVVICVVVAVCVVCVVVDSH